MRLVLHAFDPTCEMATCAVVELDVDDLLKKQELYKETAAKAEGLVKLCFWDDVVFYSSDPASILPPEPFEAFDGEKQWAVLHPGIKVETWTDEPSTDCSMLAVNEYEVAWQAYPKHGQEGLLTTVGVTWEDIIRLKGETSGQGEVSRKG